MVLARARRALPSLVVPDELALTVWGHDPYARGLTAVLAPGSARALLSAEPLPEPLRSVVGELERSLPRSASVKTASITGPAALANRRAAAALLPGDRGHMPGCAAAPCHDDEQQDSQPGHAEADHDAEEDHGGHGGHHHGEAMAITGEPSADGLVMEPIELSCGPLLTPLPGGLVLDVELDLNR